MDRPAEPSDDIIFLGEQPSLRNVDSSNHCRSMGMLQMDGPSDEFIFEDHVGDSQENLHIDAAASSNSSPQDDDKLPQEKEIEIKVEENVVMQSHGAEGIARTQRSVTEQIATPPTSPAKPVVETEKELTNGHTGQVQTDLHANHQSRSASPITTSVKSESWFDEQMSLDDLPVAQKSPEGQLAVPTNIGVASKNQQEPESQLARESPSRQVSPEEELQIAISVANPMDLEFKVEEQVKVASQSVKEPSSDGTPPERQIEKPINESLVAEKEQQTLASSEPTPSVTQQSPRQIKAREIEEPSDAISTVGEQQQAMTLSLFVSSSPGSFLTRQTDVVADKNLVAEESQQTTTLSPPMDSNAQASPARSIKKSESAELPGEQQEQAMLLSPLITFRLQDFPSKQSGVLAGTKLTFEELEQPGNVAASAASDVEVSCTKDIEMLDVAASTSELNQHANPPPILEEARKNQIEAKQETSVIAESQNRLQIKAPVIKPNPIVESDILEAYHSLFLSYYSLPPLISSTDFSTALKQSSLLIKVATLYKSLPLVRSHITASLFSHGRNLYSAIRHDAPRFLLLGHKLQCALIFKEAAIHIVGQLPSWPWSTSQDSLSPELCGFLDKKFEDFQKKTFAINNVLFQSCLATKGLPSKDIRIGINNNMDKTNFDTWIIVQMWHDWFSQQLRQCTDIHRVENRSVEKNMYKLMAQGGGAYLKIDDIMAMVEPYQAGSEARGWGNWKRGQVELNMKLLKEYAAKVVQELMVNELMGDSSDDLEYLTCIKIHEYELPWFTAIKTPEDDGQSWE